MQTETDGQAAAPRSPVTVASGAAAPDRRASAMPITPLEHPGWLEFNVRRTGLKVRRVAETAHDGAELRAVYYVDRRGRVRLPADNPYLPVFFRSIRRLPSSRTAEWLAIARPLVEEMGQRGVPEAVNLPPDVDDVRPWLWGGFQAGVGYSYLLDFPVDLAAMDRGHRQNSQKGTRLGMTVERVHDVDDVLDCLSESGARRGFALGLDRRNLQAAREILGDEVLRMYLCRDSGRRPASTCVVLYAPQARAIGWLSGTRTEFLGDCASHFLWRSAFEDLTADGATGIDFCATDSRTLAAFKSRWGSSLTVTYNVRTRGVMERLALRVDRAAQRLSRARRHRRP